MRDAFTPENYIAMVEQAFAPAVSAAALRVRESDYSARHFGNFFVDFDGPAIRLRVVRDRMQFLVDVAASGSDEWIDDDSVWFLIGAPEIFDDRLSTDLRSLEHVAQLVNSHLLVIRKLFTPDEAPNTLRRANEFRQARAKRLFGHTGSPTEVGV